MSGVLELSFLIVVLGARGFTRRGIPFSAKRNITGKWGRILGGMCLLLGLSGIGFAYWASPPAARKSMSSVGQGIVIGLLGALLVSAGQTASKPESDNPLEISLADSETESHR